MPRLESVRTDAGWHGRIVADNGETVWTTEVYVQKIRVVEAVRVFLDWGESREVIQFIDERDAH